MISGRFRAFLCRADGSPVPPESRVVFRSVVSNHSALGQCPRDRYSGCERQVALVSLPPLVIGPREIKLGIDRCELTSLALSRREKLRCDSDDSEQTHQHGYRRESEETGFSSAVFR